MSRKSPSVKEANIPLNVVKPVNYTRAEKYHREQMLGLLEKMRDEREKKRPQFNDQTFSQADDSYIKADISYIPPARNKGDTRIVTGMTREKDSTLLSTTLSYDFEPNITAYDLSDLIIDEIGEQMEDLVRKSRQMEDYDSKRPLLYRGIIARGTYYAMEMFVERWEYEKDLPKNFKHGQVQGINWSERIKKCYEGCELSAIDPKKVFLASMFEFFIQNQAAVAIVDVIPRAHAASLFSQWERWEYVPKMTARVAPATNGDMVGTSKWDADWSLSEVGAEDVERILIMKKGTNEMQIYLNGVQMLPVVEMGTDPLGNPIVSGFPLTSISPSGDYPVAKGDYEPVDGFAISKGQPAKMKVDQEVQDELLKLMIMKTKQSFWPPMANNSGKVLGRGNLLPAVITDDIPKDSVYPLIEAKGVTNSEFSFYELLKTQMEEKSVSKGYEGQENRDITATQVLENKKQQILKLGLALDGIIRFERDICLLRLRNILVHWTKAQDVRMDKVKGNVVETFRSFTIDNSKYGKQQRSRKVVNFTTDVGMMKEADTRGADIHSMEEKHKKETGIDTRYVYIDPVALRNLKARWFITVVPNDKKDDQLSRMMFVQNIREASELFGPQSLNVEKLKQRFSAVIGEDFDTWFIDQASLQELMAGMGDQGNEMGGGKGGMKAPNNKPSMKTVMGAGR